MSLFFRLQMPFTEIDMQGEREWVENKICLLVLIWFSLFLTGSFLSAHEVLRYLFTVTCHSPFRLSIVMLLGLGNI
jgi:hypothetical protein